MMSKHRLSVPDDKGSILLVSLIILVALSIIGGIALKTTNHELKLSRNDKVIQRLTTKTESSSKSAIERVEAVPTYTLRRNFLLGGTEYPWINQVTKPLFDDGDNFQIMLDSAKTTSNWKEGTNCDTLSNIGGNEGDGLFDFNDEFSNCRYRVFDVEVAPGSSLQTGNTYSKTGNMKTNVHNFASVGFCQERAARRMVLVGYRLEY